MFDRSHWRRVATLVLAALIYSACADAGGGKTASDGATAADPSTAADAANPVEAGCDPSDLDPASLAPASIVARGPNGEDAADVSELELTREQSAAVREAEFQVGIVMQTMDITWSNLQVAGMTDTFEDHGVEVVGVTDAGFDVAQQIADIENMIQRRPDAIVSIPVDDTATAEAYREVSEAGIELVFIHQPPKGLEYPADYASVISPDNPGNGQIAAASLACLVPEGGTLGIIDFGVDFFTTNQRTLRVKDWLAEHRPDIEVKQADFVDPSDAGNVAGNFLTANPDVEGLFVIWDSPAMAAVAEMRAQGLDIPVTTIDLGSEVAMEMASGGVVVALGAQEPYEQGVAEALATMKALLGEETPPFVVLPAVPVVESNLLEAYELIFQEAPPKELIDACERNPDCG